MKKRVASIHFCLNLSIMQWVKNILIIMNFRPVKWIRKKWNELKTTNNFSQPQLAELQIHQMSVPESNEPTVSLTDEPSTPPWPIEICYEEFQSLKSFLEN